jgi:DNA modification methylase
VAENIHKYDIPKVNLILTSPPYYNLEIYSDEATQSVKNDQSYEQWIDAFLKPVIKYCLDKGDDDVVSALECNGFWKNKDGI